MLPNLSRLSATMLLALTRSAVTGSELAAETACIPPGTFVQINLQDAKVVRSNLGGQGGMCEAIFNSQLLAKDQCVEEHDENVPHEILLRNVVDQASLPLVGNQRVNLRVTNLTSYYSWEGDGRQNNGIKRRIESEQGSSLFGSGDFGSINLKGPRSPNKAGWSWRSHATYA